MGNCASGRSAKCVDASTTIHSENREPCSKKSSKDASVTSSTHAACLKSFGLSDLKAATKNFKLETLVGEGGFGFVYKGWMDENTFAPARPGAGMVVAIKKLKRESYQGHKEWLVRGRSLLPTQINNLIGDQLGGKLRIYMFSAFAWQAEVTHLGQLRHSNLVKLIGYCSEADHKLLVYEFVQKGSLENHLFKRTGKPISWAARVHIAIGVARGLAFLHSLETQVIYRDLKASNILLDSDFNAKLSDFGLARNGPTGDKTHVSTRVMGTRGYAAPEYVATGHLSSKSDVYSFGVVLLELITGKRALDKGGGDSQEALIDWVVPYLSDRRRILRVMDTRLEGCYAKKEAEALAAVALQCVDMEPKFRPDVSDILPIMEELQASKHSARRRIAGT